MPWKVASKRLEARETDLERVYECMRLSDVLEDFSAFSLNSLTTSYLYFALRAP